MIESPVECVCGTVYDGAEWLSCPRCYQKHLLDRRIELEVAIDQAIAFLNDNAPMHAVDALRAALLANKRPPDLHTKSVEPKGAR